jgi:hypothetical protein
MIAPYVPLQPMAAFFRSAAEFTGRSQRDGIRKAGD